MYYTTHRFSLDRSSKKFTCPACHQNRFVKYIDNDTGDYLADNVGTCDRQDNCQYTYSPKQYFTDNPTEKERFKTKQGYRKRDFTPMPPKPIDTIPNKYLMATMKAYKANNFAVYLANTLGKDKALELLTRYNVGTARVWKGCTLFWQMDINGKLRQAKAMLYDSITGKRCKGKGHIYIRFMGKKILKNETANFEQCLYGEHLLSIEAEKDKTVAIVESEKTAILMTSIFPKYIWLATGGKHGAKWTSCKVAEVLNGRDVILYPDLGAWEDWNDKAEDLKPFCNSIKVSRLIEDRATDQQREQGLDIADFFDFG